MEKKEQLKEVKELVDIFRDSMIDFRQAMESREALSIKIGSRTTQIIRYSLTGMLVLTLGMFSLIFTLLFRMEQMTQSMKQMGKYMENMDQNFSSVAKNMDTMNQHVRVMLNMSVAMGEMTESMREMSIGINKMNKNMFKVFIKMLNRNNNLKLVKWNHYA